MKRIAWSLMGGLAALLIASATPAYACVGQIKVSLGTVEPGGPVEVRGYGFWVDPTPVDFAWDGGPTVATVVPDAAGVFSISIPAPQTAGSHRLVATQGLNDPAPAYSLVQVQYAAAASEAAAPQPAIAPAPEEPQVVAVAVPAEVAVQPEQAPPPTTDWRLPMDLLLVAVLLALASLLSLRIGARHRPAHSHQSASVP